MTTPIRLDKRVAAQLQCSRSQAQQYIEGGWISVDGVVVETPQTMVSEEIITLAAEGSTEIKSLAVNTFPGSGDYLPSDEESATEAGSEPETDEAVAASE